MTNTRFASFSTPLVFVTLVLASLNAGTTVGADYWVFVTAYVAIAIFAAWRRLWIGTVVALSVAGVRGAIALKITGAPFEILSSFFAAGLFLLIQTVGWTTAWRRR